MEENAQEKSEQADTSAGAYTGLVSLAVATLLVSAMFIAVVQPFLSALALAAICAVLAQPFYRAVFEKVGKRQALASTITVVTGIVLVVAPLIGLAYLAATQASGLVAETEELLATLSDETQALKEGEYEFPEWIPFRENLADAGPKIMEKAREVMGMLASLLASSLSGLVNGTATFFLSLFAFVYALFFFLPLETSAFRPILAHSGLPSSLQDELHERIISVSRATIKGTLLIGVIQGALGGLGFWVTGIEGAVFWSVVMAIVAAIPGIGATWVVAGGAIFLATQGETASAIGLGLWAFLVVGTIDNVLRPTLVGRDAQMSDLMIFVSTLGGLAVFGATGLVFGPVLAGVFLTIWQAVADLSGPDISGQDQQTDSTEPVADTDTETSKNKPFRLTASKEEIATEIEELKRDLNENRQS